VACWSGEDASVQRRATQAARGCVEIGLTVSQGGVNGFGGVTVEVCDGTTQTWQAEVTTFGEPAFTTGRASALASGLVFARDPAGQEVTLRVDLRDKRIGIRG
jgi:hypothetical protein